MLYNIKEFGERFAQLRKKHGYSIDELSEISSVSKRTLQQIEHGKHLARLDTLSLLSSYLDTDLLELLCNCKEEREKALCKLLSAFSDDLSHQRYLKIDYYIQEAEDIFSQKKYNQLAVSDHVFFNSLESVLLWLKGVKAYAVDKGFEKADELFLAALAIRHPNLTFDTLSNYEYNLLELNILNSLIISRIHNNHSNHCLDLLNLALSQLDAQMTKDYPLYLTLLYTLGILHLEQASYESALTIAKKGISIINTTFYNDEICYFLLIRAIALHCLNPPGDLQNIRDALILFRFEKREHLIPDILLSLEKRYGILCDLNIMTTNP